MTKENNHQYQSFTCEREYFIRVQDPRDLKLRQNCFKFIFLTYKTFKKSFQDTEKVIQTKNICLERYRKFVISAML